MKPPGDVYQLMVMLRSAKPPIWRRVRVRSEITLMKLHDILQTVMGWTNSHLHQFVVKGEYYGRPDPESLGETHDERKVRLRDVLRKPKDRMVYEYDFGDGWTHDIVLEQVLRLDPGAKYPHAVAGKRACPPEDCGGVHGYRRLLHILRDPKHADHDEMLEWAGEDFDPEAFGLGEKNRAFHGGWYLPKPHA